ncbi:MAG: hypothetical protein HUU56_10295 [Bdellovibrionaceae bacterium]|nr:hypothetical protein [Pseudobdellovibrionaceae bacterium]
MNLSSELGFASKAAQDLGVNESLIRNWTKKSNSEKFLKAVNPTFSVEEFKRLQKENERQKEVIHILKTAIAFFSQGHLR